MGYALIDGHRETVLIDSGARANAITPEYCVKHELKVRPVYELATNPTSIPVSGIGGITSALGTPSSTYRFRAFQATTKNRSP